MNARIEQTILEKLRQLPPERLAEVEDFVDFLRSRESERVRTKTAQELSQEKAQVSEEQPLPAFGVWAKREDMADVQAYLRRLRASRYSRE